MGHLYRAWLGPALTKSNPILEQKQPHFCLQQAETPAARKQTDLSGNFPSPARPTPLPRPLIRFPLSHPDPETNLDAGTSRSFPPPLQVVYFRHIRKGNKQKILPLDILSLPVPGGLVRFFSCPGHLYVRSNSSSFFLSMSVKLASRGERRLGEELGCPASMPVSGEIKGAGERNIGKLGCSNLGN